MGRRVGFAYESKSYGDLIEQCTHELDDKLGVIAGSDFDFGFNLDMPKVLGKRWTMLILKSIDARGLVRFSQLKRMISGISSTMLSERLLELEHEGLITKKKIICDSAKPKVEYCLTASANELKVVIVELAKWHKKWKQPTRKNAAEDGTAHSSKSKSMLEEASNSVTLSFSSHKAVFSDRGSKSETTALIRPQLRILAQGADHCKGSEV